ncbi:GtrA family protein [Sporolactobacillus laevolacticus]|uniref:Polysaccharide synthesis protein GtrA n=1 Tax=Sporolactobacillus laevolacticus DSM 442 TaxID=1395513 RepID=V6J237_9BACL|nr:GtrA family protein [Sporolactobacillus laevolacticus]EST13206.1 polysaccharide synthesis protein GtrA [Sporolactobacillus laevolacticus DSM 442]MDN3954159.1 GtrA family protein [Sporolactobacillus laevolacticus]
MSDQGQSKIIEEQRAAKGNKWQWMKQAILFGFVGVSNTAVDFAVFFLLTHYFFIFYAVAQVLSYAAGMLNSYIWNSKVTFAASKRSGSRVIRFVILNVAVLGITLLAMHSLLFLPLYLNKLISTLIGLCFNFVLSKLWVFKA